MAVLRQRHRGNRRRSQCGRIYPAGMSGELAHIKYSPEQAWRMEYEAESVQQTVRWYQTVLKKAAGYNVPINGNHNDAITREALRKFQRKHRLKVTGYLEVDSNLALRQIALQKIYRKTIPNPIGKRGEVLTKYLIKFQEDNGLVPDGQLGPLTMEKMVTALLKKRTRPKPPKPPEPKPPPPSKLPTPPIPPKVTPRFMRKRQFNDCEIYFAKQAWNKSIKNVYHSRWFINYMARQNRKTRIGLWNGTVRFPGNYSWGVPQVWFGKYSNARFANVRDAVNKIWQKFQRSLWKLKRQDCIVWASAHVIVAGQIRLCDSFFGDLSTKSKCTKKELKKALTNDLQPAVRILVHEMSHHIWIKSPLRQLKDRHVAPVPPCNGPCYGPGKAQMLAQGYPQHAVANPDNYAYFIQSYGSHLPGK